MNSKSNESLPQIMQKSSKIEPSVDIIELSKIDEIEKETYDVEGDS
jgi:hypothetical protein